MKSTKAIHSLLQLRKEFEKDKQNNKDGKDILMSTMGLIVDCSNVYRYQANRDFTQKLKIIDSSNQNEPLNVYLWSNKKQDFTLNIKIGDILFLNNFKIDLYNDNLQAKKAFKAEDSYFRIFNGNPELSHYNPIDKKVGIDDQDGKILVGINALRGFSKNYFAKNKVMVLFKQEGKKNDKKINSSDFDMILRVTECTEMSTHYKIRMTNDKDEFHLNYTRYIEPGVYKVRSVAEAKWEDRVCNLSGNDYTFFLEISNWMHSYDSKEWERLPSSSGKKKPRLAHIESKIVGNKKTKKMTLKELFSKDDHKEEVRVVCEVMDVCTSFEDALKKYDKENHTEKNKLSQTGEYIYSIHLLLSDDSMDGEVCNAYVYTFDEKGLEFLPDMHPDHIYGRNTLDLKQNYDNFVNRLVEESDVKDCPVELVLSPLFNNKETIYRIVDTQLLF